MAKRGMSKLPLNINDLAPQEATFELSNLEGKKFTLGRWSLKTRAWAFDTYGPEKLKEIFEKQQILDLAAIAYYMLKEKDQFKSKDEFLDAVVTTQDILVVTKAILKTVGIGEPEIKKIVDAHERSQKKEPANPNRRRPKNP